MYQTDRGSYRTKESTFKQFRHSCLGKIVIALVALALLLVIAWLTNPSPKKMQTQMWDNIRQSIESKDGGRDKDAIDVFLSNIGYTFTSADPQPDKELCDLFISANDTIFYNHTFFSTMYVRSKSGQTGDWAEPERCGVGIFGMVIPTANFKRFLPAEQPHGEYGEPLIQQEVKDDEYFGETHVDIFRYEGE